MFFDRYCGWGGAPWLPGAGEDSGTIHPYRDAPTEGLLRDGSDVAIEIKGGLIVNERGTVVTFRQRCEECSYVFDWNKTTIVPAFSSRKVRPFTCPQCGNYQEVVARHYDPDRATPSSILSSFTPPFYDCVPLLLFSQTRFPDR